MFAFDEFCCICTEKYQNLESINDTDKTDTTYKDKLLLCVPNQVSNYGILRLFLTITFVLEMGRGFQTLQMLYRKARFCLRIRSDMSKQRKIKTGKG